MRSAFYRLAIKQGPKKNRLENCRYRTFSSDFIGIRDAIYSRTSNFL